MPSEAPEATRIGPQLGDVGPGLVRGAHVGPAHDLDQGHAGAVVVDQRVVGAVDAARGSGVGRLAGVLLHVGALDADPVAVGQVEVAVDVERLVVLADLVVLGLVRVEVVLAVEGRRPDVAVQGGPDGHGQLHGPLVEHRERARQAEAVGADVGVRLVAERVRAAAEELGGRPQLAVHLESDDHLPVRPHAGAPARMRGAGSSGAAASTTAATCSSAPSERAGPSSCTPTGRPSAPGPKGTLMAGCPARLEGWCTRRRGTSPAGRPPCHRWRRPWSGSSARAGRRSGRRRRRSPR